MTERHPASVRETTPSGDHQDAMLSEGRGALTSDAVKRAYHKLLKQPQARLGP